MAEKVQTGIKGFDILTGGGFKRKSVNIIVGGPGSGKTIFCIEFLVEGIKKGEPGIYITFEEKKTKLYDDMKGFGWDLEKYEKEGKFTFLEYTPEQVKKVLIEGGGVVDNIITKQKVKRLVIDSISSFALLYEDELSRKQASLALFELINKWECTALLASQDTSKDEHVVSAAMEFEADSIIILYHMKQKGERIRALEILKMRGIGYPERTVSLGIKDGKGILVDPTSVVSF
ncbi:MAG: hypothetical protein HYS32_03820 [Candidatus Woesearchaeota archaeon]|nr:MAG: hypothetical protein HYS32_03820 [Candidatus Woesearchaeota archaeon]